MSTIIIITEPQHRGMFSHRGIAEYTSRNKSSTVETLSRIHQSIAFIGYSSIHSYRFGANAAGIFNRQLPADTFGSVHRQQLSGMFPRQCQSLACSRVVWINL